MPDGLNGGTQRTCKNFDNYVYGTFTATKYRVVKAGIRLATAEAALEHALSHDNESIEMENDLDDNIVTDYLPAATVYNELNHKSSVPDAIDEYMYYIIPMKRLRDCA
jgi:hypothetical protein